MNENFCIKCGKCCNNIPVDLSSRMLFFDGIHTLTADFEQMLIPKSKTNNITFCSCKYLKNKLCTNPNKPEECQNYPSSPFAYLPEDCGYYGLIFSKLETVKQHIRKLKEEIINYQTLLKSDKTVQRIIDHHQAIIDKYRIYGSENW